MSLTTSRESKLTADESDPALGTASVSAIVARSSFAGLRLRSIRSALGLHVITLPPGKYSIGSGTDCDIQVQTEGIAPKHCTLLVGPQQNVLKAWSPLTWINDGAVREGVLRIGDRLILGPVEFQVEANELQPTPSETAYFPPEDHLAELVRSFQASPDRKIGNRPVRPDSRERQIQELLAELQESLDNCLRTERSVRSQLTKERHVLQHRAKELNAQWQDVDRRQQTLASSIESRDEELSARLDESARFDSILKDRHEELARRSAELVALHRRLKAEESDLLARSHAFHGQVQNLNGISEQLRAENARNQAQKRQLAARADELEKHGELQRNSIHTAEEKIRTFESQRKEFEEQQTKWNAQRRSREKFLEELASSLDLKTEELDNEAARLAAWEQRLNAQAQQQSQRTSEASEFKASLGQLEAMLAEQQVELQNAKVALAERQLQFDERGEAQQRRQATLEELEQRLQERSAELDARALELERLAGEVPERQAAVSHLELALNARDQELQERLQEFETRRRELQELHTALIQRSGELDQREMEASELLNDAHRQTAELHAAHEELARREQELLRNAEAFQQGQAASLAAAPAAGEQEVDADSVEAQRAEIDLELERLLRQRREVDDEYERLERYRRSNEDERKDLKAERHALETERIMMDEERALLESWRNDLERRSQALDEAAAMPAPVFVPDRDDPVAAWRPHEEEVQIEETRPVEAVDAGDSPGRQSDEDDSKAAVQLRSQLADLFGIPSEALKEADRREAPAVARPVEPVRPDPIQERAPAPSPEAIDVPEPRGEEEFSVESYMEGLLARTRQRLEQEEAKVAPAPVPKVAPPSAPRPVEDVVEAAEAKEKKSRKLNVEEKQSLRADLHSFREVANQSARTAVAKSNVDRIASGMRLMSVASGGCWLVAAVLLSAELWMGTPQRIPALIVAAVASTFSVMAAMKYREMLNVETQNEFLAEHHELEPMHQESPEVEEPPPSRSSPLSFM